MALNKEQGSSVDRNSARRIILFKGISIILVPLLIFCAAEGLLRLFHYGSNLDLFIESRDNPGYLEFNPEASRRYFTDEAIATTGNKELFRKVKDARTTRIFVLGESTTLGYPYFHNGSFHRWLQYRLMRNFPDRNFEIINLSLTAVNSYTVADFARSIVPFQPDAVLIYTGHNEYYGALGAASTQQFSSSRILVRLLLGLRSLKLMQLMTAFYQHAGALLNRKQVTGSSRMELMAASQQIRYKSELYENGVRQFSENMTDIAAIFREHKIPVFISTLVSNDMDLPPFVDFPADSSRFPGFKPAFLNGINAVNRKDFTAASRYLKAADSLYEGSATCNYYLGKVMLASGEDVLASAYFDKASDLDGLRFRAPKAFNEFLYQLSCSDANIHLVDTRAEFERVSAHHIIGKELLTDHVHPNLKGYALMSDVFYKALVSANVLPEEGKTPLTFEQLGHTMPITETDSLSGIYRILNLKMHWPYNQPHAEDTVQLETEEQNLAYNLVFKKAVWSSTLGELYTYYAGRKEYAPARNVLEALALEYPLDAGTAEKIAMLSGMLKEDAETLFWFKRAFGLSATADRARYIFVLQLKADQPAGAIPYLDYAIQQNPENQNLKQIRQGAAELTELERSYLADPGKTQVATKIADLYLQMGNPEAARKYQEKSAETGSDTSSHVRNASIPASSHSTINSTP